MNVKNRLMAILTIALFAGSMLSALPMVYAAVGGTAAIVKPDVTIAGGPVLIDATDFTATGGTIYFYLSTDNDPIISSGDIRFDSVSAADTIGELVTVWLTASVTANDEYYIKLVDLAQAGRDCVVADGTLEVVDEDYPIVTIEDTTGNVGDTPEISVEDAGDYDNVYAEWEMFAEVAPLPIGAIDADGEYTGEDFVIPHDFKGTYNIIVWLDNVDDETFASWVQFSIEPNVDWDAVLAPDISILANALDQTFTITGTGFSEGTVAEDSIQLVLKNFMTGSTIETYETRHDEVDVEDAAPFEGDLTIIVIVDAVEPGTVDVRIPVDSATEVFVDAFYSSEPTDVADFTSITHYKMSETSGQNGDDVNFSFINLPSGATVSIRFTGETITDDVIALEIADINGAFDEDYEVFQLPGGEYSVRAIVTSGVTTRERTLGTYTVLPKFEVRETGTEDVLDEAGVEDLVDLWGSGFPADAVIQTYWFGDEDSDVDPEINVLATGEFLVEDAEIPHISGGGLEVAVKIEGEDADGDAISATSAIIINPYLIDLDDGDYDVGTLAWNDVDAEWQFMPYLDVPLYPGHIVKVVGFGFKAGEEVGLKVYDDDGDLVGSAVIGDGATAQADGDVEMVAWLPNAKALYPAGMVGASWEVAGSTASNAYETEDITFDASSDTLALVILGLANDGDVDADVKVGETLRAVGIGFRTKELTLSLVETDDDLKTVNQVNGFFDTTFIVPELSGDIEGEDYTVEVLDIEDVFILNADIVLTPAKGYVDDKFVVKGTGFGDGQSIDLTWMGVVEDEVLDTVDGDDVEDGTFSIELTVPNVVPMQYKLTAFTEGETDDEFEWDNAAFTVLDEAAAQQNATLTEILALLKALDVATLNTNVQNAVTTANAAKTAADAAKAAADSATSTAASAKTSADAAKTAADAAKTAADAATSAANSAKTAADNAASSASGLTTLVYAAIGASLIAALAAIVALMQISRKIA